MTSGQKLYAVQKEQGNARCIAAENAMDAVYRFMEKVGLFPSDYMLKKTTGTDITPNASILFEVCLLADTASPTEKELQFYNTSDFYTAIHR